MEIRDVKQNGLAYSYLLEVSKDEIIKELDAALSKHAAEAKLPGYRKGKVPVSHVEKNDGQRILMDSIGQVMGRCVSDFCKKKKIELAGNPEIKAVQLPEGKDNIGEITIDMMRKTDASVVFEIKMEQAPDVPQINLKDMELKKYSLVVSDDDIVNSKKDLLKGIKCYKSNGDDVLATMEDESDPKL